MATRGNRPKDPRGTKGGVRGTHGLGDEPREDQGLRPVAARGGTGGRIDGSHRGGTLHVGPAKHKAAPRVTAVEEEEVDESVGEEREFELSNAMAELETADQRAERREREARAALESERRAEEATASASDFIAEWEVDSGGEGVLGDPRTDVQERRDRGLETVSTPGPGPKDAGKGTARKKDLEDRGLARR